MDKEGQAVTHLVCKQNSSIDVNESARVAVVDLVEGMVFFNPLPADLTKPLLVHGVALEVQDVNRLMHCDYLCLLGLP